VNSTCRGAGKEGAGKEGARQKVHLQVRRGPRRGVRAGEAGRRYAAAQHATGSGSKACGGGVGHLALLAVDQAAAQVLDAGGGDKLAHLRGGEWGEWGGGQVGERARVGRSSSSAGGGGCSCLPAAASCGPGPGALPTASQPASQPLPELLTLSSYTRARRAPKKSMDWPGKVSTSSSTSSRRMSSSCGVGGQNPGQSAWIDPQRRDQRRRRRDGVLAASPRRGAWWLARRGTQRHAAARRQLVPPAAHLEDAHADTDAVLTARRRGRALAVSRRQAGRPAGGAQAASLQGGSAGSGWQRGSGATGRPAAWRAHRVGFQ
jgi:hypothetical protein